MLDYLKIKGVFSCEIFQDGELIDEYTDNNLVVNLGKGAVSTGLATGSIYALNKIKLGTSPTAATVGDTVITSAFTKTVTTVNSIGNTVVVTWDLLVSENNGMLIREFGLCDSNGILFARKVGLTVAKDNTISIRGTWTLTIS